MVADPSGVPLPYWLAAYRLLSAQGSREVTPRRLQEELSLPSPEVAERILSQVRQAMAHEASRPSRMPTPTGAENWLLADAFWDHNG